MSLTCQYCFEVVLDVLLDVLPGVLLDVLSIKA